MALSPHIIPYKALSRCGLEELAVHQFTTHDLSGGVLFARKEGQSEKAKARQKIIDLFRPDVWPGDLSIMTMPGVKWLFERMMFGSREPEWKKSPPTRTRFTCLENDRSIFHAALMKMPGLHSDGSCLRQVQHDNRRWSERGFENGWISRYYFGNVDDFIQLGDSFDAAWLDYTGPMSIERAKIIGRFFESSVRSTLVLTSLKARYNRDTSDAIRRSGGAQNWLRKYIKGDVIQDIEYQDGASPMLQIGFRKEANN